MSFIRPPHLSLSSPFIGWELPQCVSSTPAAFMMISDNIDNNDNIDDHHNNDDDDSNNDYDHNNDDTNNINNDDNNNNDDDDDCDINNDDGQQGEFHLGVFSHLQPITLFCPMSLDNVDNRVVRHQLLPDPSLSVLLSTSHCLARIFLSCKFLGSPLM